MKDLSFFLLKNSLGSKMKKSYRSFCNDNGSTSTLNQRKPDPAHSLSYLENTANSGETETLPTLEEMILQLELEEKMGRESKLGGEHFYGETRRRMSCVNNSDILRSARNALNQYPRFSLDGKDAMYRSSFRNLKKGGGFGLESERSPCLPSVVGGESVVWCKPGVVAKLMGLEVVPVPVTVNRKYGKEKLSSVIQRQNMRRRVEREEIERRKLGVDGNGKRAVMGSCSTNGHCVMKPIKVETPANDGAGWPMRRFL